MRGRGRPSKATGDVKALIVEMLRAGNWRETACKAAGITSNTLRNWLEADEEFRAAVDKAEAEDEANRVAHIAAEKEWKAQGWLLEKRYPQRWGRQPELVVQQAQVQTSGVLNLTAEQQVQVYKWQLENTRDEAERQRLEQHIRALLPAGTSEDSE